MSNRFAEYTRRAVIGGSAAVLVAGALPRRSRAAVKATTFVLVHGAWHGGWCWQRVASILQRDGHTVHAPTLTGVGERSHLSSQSVDLMTHVLDVVNEVKWKDLDNIVLCGHSYGGMVVTGAAEQIHDRISSIVYLDAFFPQNGQALNDIVGAVRPSTGGMVTPISAEQFNVNAADRAWVDAKTTPQSAACFSQKPSLTGAVNKIAKKTYVLAKIGTSPFFQAAYDRLSKDSAWQTHAVDSGHDVMIDKPAELADILMKSA
jgi:pimeloyl-ACP methyl ester carboxylesterase